MKERSLTKRGLSLLLSLTLALSLFSGMTLELPARAVYDTATPDEATPDEPETSDPADFSYEVLNDGTCAITDYRGTDTNVIIPSQIDSYPVTRIGTYTYDPFRWNSHITNVVIPDCVTCIDSNAFYKCVNLQKICIPDSVTEIGSSAFAECTNLSELTIGEDVLVFGYNAFRGCTNLTDIFVRSNEIDIEAFTDCTAISGLWVNEENQSLSSDEKGVLYNKDKTKLIWAPRAATEIIIPEGVVTIESDAFSDCRKLNSVSIPGSVTDIGYRAFDGCEALEYSIYDQVKYLGNGNNPYHVLMENPDQNRTDCAIHPQAKVIAPYAFEECAALSEVQLPDGLQTIGGSAFYGCTGLTSINIPDTVSDIGDWAFEDTGITNAVIPGSVIAVGRCFGSSLVNITLNEGITRIGSCAFQWCSNLLRVDIPDSVTEIGSYAFDLCENLTELHIGANVEKIGGKAFVSCDSLVRINIPTSVKKIGGYAFGCDSLSDVDITDLNAWCHINFGNWSANPMIDAENLYLNGELITDLVIPEGINEVKEFAFFHSECITSITIPADVKVIGRYAFQDCVNAKTITFRGDAPEIVAEAFLDVTATAYYPADDPSWTEDVMQDYGGDITWVPYESAPEEPDQGITLSGSLTSFQGGNLTVELWPEGASEASYSAVITDGSYCFENVPAGNYMLKVSMDHGVTREYPVATGEEEISLDVQISPIGDISGDGKVNVADTSKAYAHARGAALLSDEYALLCADVNGDGKINVADVSKIYGHTRGVSSLW